MNNPEPSKVETYCMCSWYSINQICFKTNQVWYFRLLFLYLMLFIDILLFFQLIYYIDESSKFLVFIVYLGKIYFVPCNLFRINTNLCFEMSHIHFGSIPWYKWALSRLKTWIVKGTPEKRRWRMYLRFRRTLDQ